MTKRLNYEDLIAILYMFDRMGGGGGNMKTAKLLYLFEDELFNKNVIGSNYVFKKYPMGPYNKKIGRNLQNLAVNGFLMVKERYFDKIDDLSNVYFQNFYTTKFLKKIDDLIQENSNIFNELDKIIEQFGDLRGEELKEYLYSLNNTGVKKQRILDYNDFEVILDPRIIREPSDRFYLNEDWYDTIEVMLNPDVLGGIQKGIKDAQLGNFNY